MELAPTRHLAREFVHSAPSQVTTAEAAAHLGLCHDPGLIRA